MKNLTEKLKRIIERADRKASSVRPSDDKDLSTLTYHGGWSVGYMEGRLEGLQCAMDLIDDATEASKPKERSPNVRAENIERRYIGDMKFSIYPSVGSKSMFWTLEVQRRSGDPVEIIDDIASYSTVNSIIDNVLRSR